MVSKSSACAKDSCEISKFSFITSRTASGTFDLVFKSSLFLILRIFLMGSRMWSNSNKPRSAVALFVKYIPSGNMIMVENQEARSEERRVGKECRCRWRQYHEKKKEIKKIE